MALRRVLVWFAGKRMYLWRAVNHVGEILDVLVQRRRDKRAAPRPMRRFAGETRLRAEAGDHRPAAFIRRRVEAARAQLST